MPSWKHANTKLPPPQNDGTLPLSESWWRLPKCRAKSVNSGSYRDKASAFSVQSGCCGMPLPFPPAAFSSHEYRSSYLPISEISACRNSPWYQAFWTFFFPFVSNSLLDCLSFFKASSLEQKTPFAAIYKGHKVTQDYFSIIAFKNAFVKRLNKF